MIRIVESFQNLPSWITNNISKSSLEKLNKRGIDLYNCTYEEVTDLKSRDSRWTNEDNIVAILLDDGRSNKLYMYDNARNWDIQDPYMLSDNKDASQHSRKWLLDHALKIAIIKKSENKKSYKDPYTDDRYRRDRRTGQPEYYGQQATKDINGNTRYFTPSGRDKSGYEIPNISDKLSKLYKFNMDNYAEVLERYYNKLNDLKSKIFDMDIKRNNSRQYSRLLRNLSSAVENYNDLNEEILDRANKFNKLPEEERTPERFEEIIGWVYHNKELDNDISELLKGINEISR